MPPIPLVVAVSLAAASLAGTVHLALDELPLSGDAAALTAAGLVVLTLVAVSGVLVARSRWSRPTAIGVAAGWIALGATGHVGVAAGIAIVAGAVALGGATGPWLRRWLRHRPALEGPPPAAAAVLLLLLVVPVAVGLTSVDGVTWPGWALVAWSPLVAFGLGRALPGALLAIRVAHAPACVAVGLATGALGAVVLGALGVVTAAVAWRKEVSLAAAADPGRPGRPVRIPPELAPPGVLDAARSDQAGTT